MKKKINGVTELVSEKTEALFAELYERVEAATSSYSATGEFLQYIYSMLVDKNHQTIRSRCLAHGFSFTDILERYWLQSSFIKKKFLWLLSIYMDVASYCCYEKGRAP